MNHQENSDHLLYSVAVHPLSLQNDNGTLLPIKLTPNKREILKSALKAGITTIFNQYGGLTTLLQGKQRVFIKPNAIDSKPYSYVRSEFIEALIECIKDVGIREIFLFENSTQSNYTRIVFDVIGYIKICKRFGVTPIYLDEEKTQTFSFRSSSNTADPPYDLATFELSSTVVHELIENRARNFYIDVPKLKTHSMTGISLGIKNQWAFPRHVDRKLDHNYHLHSKLVDILRIVQPDFTLIEGVEGTIHGHYPPQSLLEEVVKSFRVIIGGLNVIATDIIGARIFGLTIDEIPHLRIAIADQLAPNLHGIEDIQIYGDITPFSKHYSYDLLEKYPPDVRLHTGKTLWCREGCRNNPLTLLQVLWLDFHGKENFDIVMGKGFELEEIEKIVGPVLVIGHCAIEEVGDQLIKRLGKKHVYFSHGCNDLTETAAALFHLMHISPIRLVPMNPFTSIRLYLLARLHHSHATVPSLFANFIKTV